jgi:hypothetical protein
MTASIRGVAVLMALAIFASGTDAYAAPKKANKNEKARSTQSGQELRMLELQSLTSRRATALQQTTKMLKNSNCPECVKNMGR